MDLSFSSAHFGGTIESDEFPLPTFPVASSSTSSSPEPVSNNLLANGSGVIAEDAVQFICEICNKRCVSRENLRNHRRHVHPKKCYACPVCQKVFKSTSSLRRHASVHTAERPYSCSFCGRNYSCLFNCRVHERSHLGSEKTANEIFKCDSCSKNFKSQSALVAHKNRAHPNQDSPISEELPSLPVFPDYEMPVDLSANRISQSVASPSTSTSTSPTIKNQDGTFSCGACGKTFLTKSLLSYHRRNVHPSVLHECHECGKTFKSKSHLRRHGRVHSGERPFPCGLCSRRYSDARHVKEHQAKFHGISAEKAKVEQASFDELVNPATGMEQVFFGGFYSTGFIDENQGSCVPSSSFAPIPSQGPAFQCSICGQKRKNSALLRRHVVRHHARLRLGRPALPSCHCPRCGSFAFCPPVTLGWHLRRHFNKK